MIFFWGIIFIIIFYGVKYLSKGRPDEGKGQSHEEILKERYAKGEIDKEEYEKMKQVLRD
jgi:putative membrane protein